MLDLTSFDAVLREQYLPVVRDQLANETVLLKHLQRKTVEGKRATLAVRNSRNTSAGPVADNAALPAAGNQSYTESIIPQKYLYARIQISGPTQTASKGAGAIATALAAEVNHAKSDLAAQLNEQMFHGGVLSTANGAGTASTALTVNDNIHYFKVGSQIKIGTAAVTTISAVNSTTKVVTLAAALTWSDADTILAADGNGTTTSFLSGLRQAIDDGTFTDTFQGIQRSTNDFWKATVVDKTSAGSPVTLTEAMIREAVTAAQKSGGHPTLGVMQFEGIDKYESLLQSERRYVNSEKIDGGFTAISYRGIPLVGDKDAPDNTIYFVDAEVLGLYISKDFSWSPVTPVSGYDAVESVLSVYGNLGAENCARNCVLKGVSF